MADINDFSVLVVDDIRETRKVIKKLLASLNFTSVSEAVSGRDALEKLKAQEFDLILCDFNLTDTKGLEVLKKVRASERFKDVPFVMITSDVDRNDLLAAQAAGVTGYILKPFTIENLSEGLSNAFTKHGIRLPELESRR